MQALPFATQLLARLGAEVVKVEHPVHGESGRGALPAMDDPEGRSVGATFLRNNLDKRSVGLDLKSPEGRELFLELAPATSTWSPRTSRPGTMDRLGLGYDDVAERHPRADLRVGVGLRQPRRLAVPRLARVRDGAPRRCRASTSTHAGPTNRLGSIPVGALGDISSALFAVIGILAALRHRERTGQGQLRRRRDARLDDRDDRRRHQLLVAGRAPDDSLEGIMTGFMAQDGWFVVQVVREHQFEKLADLVGRPSGSTDDRLASRRGWADAPRDVIRPAVESWASSMTRLEACDALGDAGIAAGPATRPAEVIDDEHVARRNMLVEMAAHRRRRRAGADPRQPGEAVGAWPRAPRPGCRGSASTPTTCCAPSSASTDDELAAAGATLPSSTEPSSTEPAPIQSAPTGPRRRNVPCARCTSSGLTAHFGFPAELRVPAEPAGSLTNSDQAASRTAAAISSSQRRVSFHEICSCLARRK